MGRDKAQLRLGETSLLQRTIEELETIVADVVVVGRSASGVDGARALADECADSGPVAGLVTGLRAARFPLCVAVACDLPFLDARVLRAMLDLASGFDAVVPLSDGHPQPLHAVYGHDVLSIADKYFSGGGRSLRGLLGNLHVRWVPEEEMTRIDPSGRSLTNVNTPEEWAQAMSMGKPYTA